jgi:GNAT superfamily N-acetyltransferase
VEKAEVRTAVEADLACAVSVYLTSLEDMLARLGQPPAAMDFDCARSWYGHLLKTGLFYVAGIDGKTVGLSCGIMREQIFFLSGFWVLPGFQGAGTGARLIKSVFQKAGDLGARTCCVWSSLDAAASAQYLSLGMFPGFPLFKFLVPCQEYALPPDYSAEKLTATAAGSIDRAVRGCAREVDHDYLLAQEGTTALLLRQGRRPVGYCYADASAIGPVAWLAPEHAAYLLGRALYAPDGQPLAKSINIPGCNQLALQLVLGRKAKLNGLSNFLTTHSFGKLEQYIPSGPLLF